MKNVQWYRIGFTALVVLSYMTSTAYADPLSAKQQQLAAKEKETSQLQNKISQTKSDLANQKQKVNKVKLDLHNTQSQLTQIEAKINANEQMQNKLQEQIDRLNQQIEAGSKEYSREFTQLQALVRDIAENGKVSYIDVILNSTSFSDFLSRSYLLTLIARRQKALLKNVSNIQKKLISEENQQNSDIQMVRVKQQELQKLQTMEIAIKGQKEKSIQELASSMKVLEEQEATFSAQMHLTQEQVKQLKQQIAEEEAIMRTKSGKVVEQDLRYYPVSPQKLYDYVQHYDKTYIGAPSDFSISDMKTICEAGKKYDVNPILLVAITGAEESFVPTRFPIHSYWAKQVNYIHKNPFNVYYSWMWTKMNRPSWGLSTTADIAANTVRHKLSTAPRYGDSVFQWLNDPRNPWGLYATDRAWSDHVKNFYYGITVYVNA